MVDFTIPLNIVQQLPYAKVKLLPENKISVSGVSEGFELKGTLLDGNIAIEKIHHSSEGSGHTWDDFLEALKHSKGSLVATQVWEGGDSITKLIVKDGVVEQEQVEL
jgi:hypothetical protein